MAEHRQKRQDFNMLQKGPGNLLKEITHLRHFFLNVVINFRYITFLPLFRNGNYFVN